MTGHAPPAAPLLVETRTGRAVARRVLRTRVDPRPWTPVPVDPLGCVAQVTAPLLLVHGDRDRCSGPEHPRALAAASGAPLWLEPGSGHAETAIGPALADRIGAHVAQVPA